jgi:hypothetical protein
MRNQTLRLGQGGQDSLFFKRLFFYSLKLKHISTVNVCAFITRVHCIGIDLPDQPASILQHHGQCFVFPIGQFIVLSNLQW